ncbi:SpoIIE family protein phosphatase [Leptospira kmetyi]|nr:SpoIIE family protein phosphatase [Leptospira kmetyi]
MFSKTFFVLSILVVLNANCGSDSFTSAEKTGSTNFQDLSGTWEMYTDFQNLTILQTDPNAGSEFISKLDPSFWKPVSIPSNLKEYVDFHRGADSPNQKEVPFLLRKKIEIKNPENSALSLSLGKISDHATVFWNGETLHEESFHEYENSKPQGYDRTRIYEISKNRIFKKNEILVFVRPYFEYEFGILSGPVAIGSSAEIWKRFYLGEIGGLLVFGSFLLVGIFFLFLSVRERKWEENFYFALFLIFFALFQISLSDLKYNTGWRILHLKKIEYSFLAFLFPFFCRFLNSLFRKAKTKFHSLLELGTSAALVWILFSESVERMDQINRYVLQVSWIGFVFLSLRILLPNLKRSFESKMILFGILFLLVCVGSDVLSQRGMFKMIRLSGLGVCGFLGFLTLILADKFVRMKEKLKSWNRVLESAIRNRTETLSSTLEEIKRLKEQQDGDYFLITLLFQPFLSKNHKTDSTKIEIHRKQYKKFQFKNRSYEIGGDVVLNETVLISGIEYRVLINADAMGKSLQGASGALIFCSIVKSFLQTPDYEFRNPENWLFLLYRNLQAVFESFDGSMLVSGILSLYRISSGDLFFLNCEHPQIVLVRNGKAVYLREDEVLRKIGFPDSDLKVKIEHFKLLPGDTILYGSDGREDLYIQDSSCSSEKQKSSEPGLFFDLVEKEIPDLDKLEDKILEIGELSDDLSFLKIQAAPETNFEEELSRCRILIRQGNEFFQKEEFQKACFHYARASLLRPGDLKLARMVLLLAKKSQNFKLIRFFSEKILLRTDGFELQGSKDSPRIKTYFRLENLDITIQDSASGKKAV